MDELVKLVSEKADISKEQSKQAVDTVVAFLKDKLPKPVADQVDKALSGEGGDMEDLQKGLGGMFGGR